MSIVSADGLFMSPSIDVAGDNRASLADALNNNLASMIALYLKTKNFHWHVSGPHFRDYHLLFDEQASQILSSIDPLAERVRKIGATTVRSVGDVARRQAIRDNDALFVTPCEMLNELLSDNQSMVRCLREVKRLADQASDNATSSMIDDLTDAAEQRVWFLLEASRQ